MKGTADPALPSRRQAAFTIGVLFLVAALCTIDRLAINLVVDPIRADLGISDTQMSLLQGLSFSLFYSIAGIPLGLLADSRSRRNLLIFGIALWSLATLASSIATSYSAMFAARALVGAGEAALWPVAVSIIGDIFPARHRGKAISSIILGQIFGSSLALVFGGMLIEFADAGGFVGVPFLDGRSSWRILLTLCAVCGLVLILVLAFIREPARIQPSQTRNGSQFSAALAFLRSGNGAILLIFSVMFLSSLAVYTNTAWTVPFYLRHFSLTPGELGPKLGMIGLVAGIMGTLLAGFTSDRAERLGRRSTKITIAMVALIGCVPSGLIVLSPDLFTAFAFTAIAGVCFPFAGAVMIIVLQDVTPPNKRGLAMAIVTLIGGLFGASLGPFLAATVTDHVFGDAGMVGWSLMAVILPALAIAMGILFFLHAKMRMLESIRAD